MNQISHLDKPCYGSATGLPLFLLLSFFLPSALSQTSPKPKSFPHRIWAACDFEAQTPDYAWFGSPQTNQLPVYPGNGTALQAAPGPYQDFSAVMAGINPVPGPRIGYENWLFLRYHLSGSTAAIVQHFSLTSKDNWHVNLTGLRTNQWSELAVNFTAHAQRNDGSTNRFVAGERMDDFKMFAGKPDQAATHQLFIDDIIFFSFNIGEPPEPEPFPQRIILLAAFDTGEKEKYWPGEFTLVHNPPRGANWSAARNHRKKDGGLIRIQIDPVRQVGSRSKLRFRYHLTGGTEITAQIFDATVQDNRHVVLKDLPQNQWRTIYVDFARDSRRNDGTPNSPFAAGNIVDDLFFFTKPGATLHVDEVVLFDAAAP